MCFGLAGRNWPYLQACLQAGEAAMPQSASVTALYAMRLSLASPTCNDDDEWTSDATGMCATVQGPYGSVPASPGAMVV
jgi:hypothetical protein